MNTRNAGYSIIEMLIVLTVITILTSGAFFYLHAHQRLYKTDNQALQIADLLQEARQRSLTQRKTMRVEIDLTESAARLIDENKADTADDDKILREITLYFPNEVRIDAPPSQITNNPPEPLPVPNAQFKISSYPLSVLNQVCTIRFQSSGSVVDAGTNATGSNAVTKGVTLHLWTPAENDSEEVSVARALTVIGSTGSIRLWEFHKDAEGANKWKDSRRFGVYGGQGNGTSGN
jgi:prepilin-type N-terminal cleavage/methylation domain-containing protein